MVPYPAQAEKRIKALIEALEPMVSRDPEQEITGIAVPVFEAALDAIRAEMPDDPVVQATTGAYAHEIESGSPVRAVDALLVARQLQAVLPDRSGSYSF